MLSVELLLSLRRFLLRVLAAAPAVGLTEELLLDQARERVAMGLTLPELQAELRKQADRGWVQGFTSATDTQRWRSTELGRATAKEEGLA